VSTFDWRSEIGEDLELEDPDREEAFRLFIERAAYFVPVSEDTPNPFGEEE